MLPATHALLGLAGSGASCASHLLSSDGGVRVRSAAARAGPAAQGRACGSQGRRRAARAGLWAGAPACAHACEELAALRGRPPVPGGPAAVAGGRQPAHSIGRFARCTVCGMPGQAFGVGCCAAAPPAEKSVCCLAVPEEPCGASPTAGELPRRSSDQACHSGRASRGAPVDGHGVSQSLESEHLPAMAGAGNAPRGAGVAVGGEPGREAAQDERQAAQQLLEHLQLLLAAAVSDGSDASSTAGAPAVPDGADAAAGAEPAAASAAGSRCSTGSACAAPSAGLTPAGLTESSEGAALACAAGGSAESIVPFETPTFMTSLPDRGGAGGLQGRGSGSGAGAGDMAASPIGGMLDAQEAVLTRRDGLLLDAAASEQPEAQARQAPADLPTTHLLGETLPPPPLQAAAAEPEGAPMIAVAAAGPAALWTSKHLPAGAPPPQKVRIAIIQTGLANQQKAQECLGFKIRFSYLKPRNLVC